MDRSDLIPNLRHANFLPHLRGLAIACATAFLIGWNREQGERGAGPRAFPLVAVAQHDVAAVICLFTAATLFILRRLKKKET